MGKENSQEHLEQIWESGRTNHDTDRGKSCTRDNIRLHLSTASSLRLMNVSLKFPKGKTMSRPGRRQGLRRSRRSGPTAPPLGPAGLAAQELQAMATGLAAQELQATATGLAAQELQATAAGLAAQDAGRDGRGASDP